MDRIEIPFPEPRDEPERAAQAARLAAVLAGWTPFLELLPLFAQADESFDAGLHPLATYARGWFGDAPPEEARTFLAAYDALFPDGPPSDPTPAF